MSCLECIALDICKAHPSLNAKKIFQTCHVFEEPYWPESTVRLIKMLRNVTQAILIHSQIIISILVQSI